MLRPLQNTGRSGTKRTSEHVGHLGRDAKNDPKSARRLLGQGFLLRARANEVLERHSVSAWVLLGLTWPAFGRSWAALGTSWALSGRILDSSWALLGVF